jgi:hypothetical protein
MLSLIGYLDIISLTDIAHFLLSEFFKMSLSWQAFKLEIIKLTVDLLLVIIRIIDRWDTPIV